VSREGDRLASGVQPVKYRARSGRLLALPVCVGLAGLALSLHLARRARQPAESLARSASGAVSASSSPSRSLRLPSSPSAGASAQVYSRLSHHVERRGAELSAAQRDAPPGVGEHPHPITAEHRRIFEENDRVAALDGAMDRGDFMAMRRMNAAYRRDYPEDAHVLQRGYDLIADCLEQRTPGAIDAARRFWQTQRASALRRHVRRHCLEERQRP
jgi:hypothetical protein